MSIVGRLSTLQSVHYQRLHCKSTKVYSLPSSQGEEEVVDQLGHRQFEEDMKMDREERMRMRAVPRGQKEWNADQQGGMEQGLQEGVDDAMMQEMHVSDMRRKEAAKQLEAKDQQRRWALIRIFE